MKKISLKKKINDLKKYMKTPVAQDALEKLLAELDYYEEDKTTESQDLVVPQELVGQGHAVGLFSDGGCRGNPGPGAYAFLVQNSNGDILLEGGDFFEYTTNNQMELRGVIEGLKALRNNVGDMPMVYIYTDSKYVVNGMSSWVAGWKARGWKKADKKTPENVELWKELDTVDAQFKSKYIWVKGHAGHPQNEKVDKMANELMDANGC